MRAKSPNLLHLLIRLAILRRTAAIHITERLSFRSCFLLGWISIWIPLWITYTALFAGLDEPFPYITDFIVACVYISPITLGVTGFFLVVPTLFASSVRNRDPREWNRRAAAGALSQVPLFLPLMAYALIVFVAEIGSGHTGIAYLELPEWMTWPIWLWLTGCTTDIVFILLWLVLAIWVPNVVPAIPYNLGLCRKCKYDLHGSIKAGSDTCPECGEPIPKQHTTSNA